MLTGLKANFVKTSVISKFTKSACKRDINDYFIRPFMQMRHITENLVRNFENWTTKFNLLHITIRLSLLKIFQKENNYTKHF